MTTIRHTGVAAALVLAAGCAGLEALLGPRASEPVASLESVSRIAGSWSGTWRNTRGASGNLNVTISPASGERVTGTVEFSRGVCPAVAPFEGALADRKLTATADLGGPCGTVVLEIVESRSEVPRLTGSFKNAYPETGLFAIYPR